MGFNSAFKGLKLLKNPGNGRLNNLNDPDRPQCVKRVYAAEAVKWMHNYTGLEFYRVKFAYFP